MYLPDLPLLAFAGSTRANSWNSTLLREAVECVRALGAAVELVDLREFPLPIFDSDLEAREGAPANARRLRSLMQHSSGFLLASPEYNGALSPLVKNLLDWASRPGPGEDEKAPFRGKPAALLSASPGGFGGFRGLLSLASILSSMGMMVLPDYVIVGMAPQAFSADGHLVQQRQRDALAQIVSRLVALAATLPATHCLASTMLEKLRHPASAAHAASPL